MNTILITGADGYLGQLFSQKFLETDCQMILWVRANSDEEIESKTTKIVEKLGNRQRYRIAFGNLAFEEPLKMVDPKPITHIIHCAALTNFNVGEVDADKVNRDGTRKVLEFARQCPNLQHYGQISTVYATGLEEGHIDEKRSTKEAKFANHYERSKSEAESILMDEFDDLPWSIYRIATIISDDTTGRVTQYNVFHNTIRLLFHGLISLVPGKHDSPLYFVTGEYCGESIFNLISDTRSYKEIYNICYGMKGTITLQRMLDVAFERFQQDEGFKRRRVLKPLLSDKEAFNTLSRALEGGLGSQILRESLESIRPFADQMYLSKDIKNEKHLPWVNRNNQMKMDDLVKGVVDYLVKTKWGREIGAWKA